jgi:NitT/TauT family transport system substrate-binding protein
MPLRRRVPAIAAVLCVLLTLAGCGLLGADTQDTGSAPKSAGAPEKAKVKVAVLPTMDTVPLYLAMDSGYFAKEGLEVTTVAAASGQDCVTKLVSGDVDFAFSSYTPFFLAKVKGAADIKLVADATSAAPGNAVVVTMPNSGVRTIKDLTGKRVGITARFTMSHLLVESQLKVNGVESSSIQWTEVAFPQMADRLAKGQIDAAFLTEPFLQQAAKSVGAYRLFDTATGPTADIPLTGYGATGKFVNANRRTVEAFQRAMKRATDEAHGDRTKVDPLLEKIAKVDTDTAHLAVLTNFVSSLDPVRIQRVVDLMVEFKALDKKFDVSDMIVRPPTT